MNCLLDRAATILSEKIGLNPHSLGRAMLQNAVRQRMQTLGISADRDYFERLESDAEIAELIEHMVVPESWFFRDTTPMRFIQWFVKQQQGTSQRRSIRILSVPSSTGEEPYSIAIALLNEGLQPEQFEILGVDVSTLCIERAKDALYGRYSLREKSPEAAELEKRFLEPSGSFWTPIETARKSVHFKPANLVDRDFLCGHRCFDVIFCRNLLIYLTAEARKIATANLIRLLAPSGVIYLGHADGNGFLAKDFQPVNHEFVFALTRPPTTLPASTAPGRQPLRLGGLSPRPHVVRKGVDQLSLYVSQKTANKSLLDQTVPTRAPTPSQSMKERNIANEPSIEQVKRLANKGDLAAAKQVCRRLIEQHSACAPAHCLMGVIEQALGDLRSAERSLRRAEYLAPDDYETLLKQSVLARRLGNMTMARQYTERAERANKRETIR